MNKIRVLLFTLLCLLVALPVFGAKAILFSTLTGGSQGALDAISVDDANGDGSTSDPLETGDRAFGIYDGMFYVYEYDETSTESESVPEVIVPDDQADGTGAWERADVKEDETQVSTIQYVIDGGGETISTGNKGHVEIPWDCEITQVSLYADQAGYIAVDFWVDSYANYPPTSSDSITGGNEISLSDEQKTKDSTLSGWTTNMDEGNILVFNVDSVSDVTRVTVSILVER